MNYPSKKVRDFICGISYDSTEEDKGHFAIRRKCLLSELIDEIAGFMKNGHNHPTFPGRANPTVQYAWDLSDGGDGDGDCYHEIIEELDRIILQ